MEYSKRDDEICRLLSTGDPKGMDLLFNTYYSRLVVWADTFLKDIQLAEGVVQEFFIALWEKRKQKELTAPFLTSFLYVSVRNRCLNKLEKQDIFHNTTDLQEVHLAFEEYNEKHDRILTQVLQEMENLPPRSRVIIQCFHFNRKNLIGKCCPEIAGTIGQRKICRFFILFLQEKIFLSDLLIFFDFPLDLFPFFRY